MMIILKCKKCKKPFKVLPYRENTAICCSRKCLWYITKEKREKLRIEAIKGKKAHNNKQISIKCLQCSKKFKISPSRKGKKKFCGLQCYSVAKRGDNIPPHRKYKRIHVNGKRVLEHRHIMEGIVGRPLTKKEHVHHINHNGLDNRPENLQLLSISDHIKLHSHGPY